MAVGNAVTLNDSLTGSGILIITPSGSTEWIIHNVAVTGAATLQTYDGTNTVVLYNMAAGQWLSNLQIHVNATTYLQLVDTSGNTNLVHYDGIVSF
jgi:hypothetical protein